MIPQQRTIQSLRSVHRRLAVQVLGSLGFAALFCFAVCGCAFRPDGNLVRVRASDLLGNGEAQYDHAMRAYRKGETEKARRGFERVLRHHPRHASAHNNLGLIYYDARQLIAAAEHFDVAIDLLPDSPVPLNNLGMTLEAGGRVDEAIGFYVQAHEINPENPLYLGNLLRARIRLGEQSPELIEDLRFLAFIETRPEWVTWVDEMLALRMNPMLDRGPTLDEENPLDGNRRRTNDPAPILKPEELPEASILEPIEPLGSQPLSAPESFPRAEIRELQLDGAAPGRPAEFWDQLNQSEALPVPQP